MFVKTHKNEQQFHILLKFLVGLNRNALLYLRDSVELHISTIQLHWLYESQSPSTVCKYLGTGAVKYNSKITSSIDLYALTYCLCHSNCEWMLHINSSNLTSVFNSDSETGGKIKVLSVVGATSSRLQMIFSLPKHLFSNLHELCIGATEDIDSVFHQALSCGLLPSLTDLGFFNLSFSLTSTLPAMSVLLPNLSGMRFQRSILTSSDMIQLCTYISSLGPSSKLDLYFYSNAYSNDSLQLLISAMACSKSLHALHLGSKRICQTDIEMLSVALSTSPMLKYLELYNCCISGEGAETLASGLEDNKTLVELDLTRNHIDNHGATALGSMLIINTSLKKLNLSENKLIGIEGSVRMINAMEQNKTLHQLVLPSECEPVEFKSIMLQHIREEKRIYFS